MKCPLLYSIWFYEVILPSAFVGKTKLVLMSARGCSSSWFSSVSWNPGWYFPQSVLPDLTCPWTLSLCMGVQSHSIVAAFKFAVHTVLWGFRIQSDIDSELSSRQEVTPTCCTVWVLSEGWLLLALTSCFGFLPSSHTFKHLLPGLLFAMWMRGNREPRPLGLPPLTRISL